MIVLVTGHRGRIGPAIVRRLEADGHIVRGFDLADGDDVLDAAALARAALGVDCIVHLAGLADDRGRPDAEVFAVNLTGTANALVAAEAAGVSRFVNMSSGKALGMLERAPAYLPMDDDHPGAPTRPYGLAKWLAEEMVDAFGRRTGMDVISLRAVAVFDDEGYARLAAQAAAGPPPPPPPLAGRAWHMGVHVHVEDVADATAAAVIAPGPLRARALIAASDVADARPTRMLVDLYASGVPWRGDEAAYTDDPHRGLVDLGAARRLLGWEPRRRWPAPR